MIIISARLCYLLAWFSGFSKTAKAVTVFPFIFVRSADEVCPWLITHERIHIRQQLELLLVGAFILHGIEIIFARLVLRKSWSQAYYWSSAEQDAYRNQHNAEYLKHRPLFAQFYYLVHKRVFTHADGVVTYFD